ncbi:MAG TPA: dihydrofolate reductase [Acidimicrobiales bacterium]|nr:dihydrofolate reductase [Acidimicrobiales bacterium]
MIRAIAAIDDRLGLATDTGIPWHIQADSDYFRAKTAPGTVLMGYATYLEFAKPLPDRPNYVATNHASALHDGFLIADDVDAFLRAGGVGGIWVIGGATLFASTLGSVQELYLTRVSGDFGCTKFFPVFEPTFQLATDNPSPKVEGTPDIRFQVWSRIGAAAP